MKVIEITDGDARFKYVRRESDPFHWDLHEYQHGGRWIGSYNEPATGMEVLWACASTLGDALDDGQAPS
jgi:hypothetical protein